MQDFHTATGLVYTDGRLFLGAKYQLWRLDQAPELGKRVHPAVDTAFIPRAAHVIGETDIHELAVDRDGRIVFVSSLYSCLAMVSDTASFRPFWRPSFVSALVPEDRCHLNGLAMQDGLPRYTTAVGRSDTRHGWRDHRAQGGVLIDVANDAIVAENLSAPHSPRVWRDAVWLLESGRGMLVRIDPVSGRKQDIAFCPGFLRGLTFHGDHAVVTLSCLRPDPTIHYELEDALRAREIVSRCGVMVIDTVRGVIADWLYFEAGHLRDMFDVAVLSGVHCPTLLAGRDPNSHGPVTAEEMIAPLPSGAIVSPLATAGAAVD